MKQIAIILIATFALFSCTKENMEGGSPTAQGVQVIFKTSDFAQLNTRAASETQLKDVTILQFKDGVLIQKELLENVSTSSAITLGFLEQLPAANLDEKGKLFEDTKENLIYFIANAKAVTNSDVNLTKGVSTFADLKTLKFGTNNLSEVLPMTGEYYGGVAEGATTQINVTLTRAVAKVNFAVNTTNFMVDGVTPSIVVNSITLCDVPKEITPYPCDNRPALPANGSPGIWAGVMTPFPTYVAVAFESYGTEKNNSTTPLTNYVAYMPENARGSFTSIANNKNKKPESLDAEHQGGLTYILVDLDYTTASGIAKNAKYKIYIGGDAAGDMNLLRNTQYNITTYIYGANEADTRIDVTPIFDPESGLTTDLTIQKPANCYLISQDANLTGFTIPLSQVRRGWNYIKSSEKNDALLSTFDNLVKAGDWEIITLWKTWSGTNNITGKKAEGISFKGRPDASEENYFATLTFPTDLEAGNNAVIALVDKNDNNKIYWSWHLWITDYNPDAQTLSQMNGQTHSYFGAAFQPLGAYYGKAMMDRNLGATATGVTGAIDPTKFTNTTEAVSYYGLFYQFGRKDPFVGSSNGSTALVTIYDANGDAITDKNVAAGNNSNLANAVHTPMNFYTIESGNWTMPSEDLWNSTGSKSAFDPCPAGWRIPIGGTTPTNNPWAGFGDGGANSVGNGNYLGDYFKWKPANVSGSNIVGSAGGFYSYGEDTPTQAWYPASGVRVQSTSNLTNVGANGYLWNSLPNSTTSGSCITFHSTLAYPNLINSRASGYSVRCVQE